MFTTNSFNYYWNNDLSFSKNTFRLIKRIINSVFSEINYLEKLILPVRPNNSHLLKCSDLNLLSVDRFPTPKFFIQISDFLFLFFNFITVS